MTSTSFKPRGSDEREPLDDHPLGHLPREDLDLIVRLVLASGSLKGLAESYGVSYPTIRNRLNRVIERLRGAMEGRRPDPLREVLAGLIERGQITPSDAKRILEASERREKGDAR